MQSGGGGRERSSRTAKAKLVLASLQGILPTLVNILLQTVVVGKFPPLQIFNISYAMPRAKTCVLQKIKFIDLLLYGYSLGSMAK